MTAVVSYSEVPGLFLIHSYFKFRSELQCLCATQMPNYAEQNSGDDLNRGFRWFQSDMFLHSEKIEVGLENRDQLFLVFPRFRWVQLGVWILLLGDLPRWFAQKD